MVDRSGATSGRLRGDADFRRFLVARLVSLGGSSVTLVAFPVAVYSLSSSPLLTAVVTAVEALPYLLFGLVAGALADRFDRKRVMVTVDLLSAAVLFSIPVAHWLGGLTVAHLIVAAFAVFGLWVFFDAADFGALPALVGRDLIPAANSAMWSSSTVVETTVPLMAGAAFAVVAPPSLIAIDVLSYLASACLVRAIVRPLSDPARRVAGRLDRAALVADVKEGLRFLWRQPTVRAMTVVGAAQSLSGGAFVGQMVVWADRDLDVREGDWRLGVVFSAWGIGVLVASLVVPRLARRVGAARLTLVFLPFSALLAVLTTLSGQWVVGSVAMAAWGVAYMGVVLNTVNYRQQVTPEPLMSRVNTTGRMLSFGLGWPLGSVLGGTVAEVSGPRGGMLAGAAVLVLGCGYAWLSPLRRQGPLPSEVVDEPEAAGHG